MLQGLVVGAKAQSTALAVLDSSNGFDLAAAYSLAQLWPSSDAAFAELLVTLLCERASFQDLIPATQYVYRDMDAPQHVLQRLAAVLASVSGKSSSSVQPQLGVSHAGMKPLLFRACFNTERFSQSI